MSASAMSAEMAFYRTERDVLISQGVLDYDQQSAILKRRWDTMKTFMTSTKVVSAAPPAVDEVPFEQPLTTTEMDDYGLVLSRVDVSDVSNIRYMYAHVQVVDPDPPVRSPVDGKRKADGEPSSAAKTKKSAKPFDLRYSLCRFKNDTLRNMCEDLGAPVSGNKLELVSRIFEMMR